MATPLRFRYDPGHWDMRRVRNSLLSDLDANIGADMGRPWYKLDHEATARRFDMENGDTALFAWGDDGAYWLGNTETPKALWQTEKIGFGDAPEPVADWAQQEFLAELYRDEPWLKSYPALARFFLPVLSAKDGRETNRRFFRDHAAGFPDVDRDIALSFYDSLLANGVLDEYRHTMAGKLGTSDRYDSQRMAAAMSEFTAAKLLTESGYDIEPEATVTSGHAIDYRVTNGTGGTLVEVTRPSPPSDRSANSPVRAVRETVNTKTSDQLDIHGGGVTLFVDCSSFGDQAWSTVRSQTPDVGHKPAAVFRVRPDRGVDGYTRGSLPIGLARILHDQ